MLFKPPSLKATLLLDFFNALEYIERPDSEFGEKLLGS